MLDFAICLDRSGSMQSRKSDHEGGLRSFIEDQRTLSDEMRVTLIQFDTTDPCEIKLDRVPLAEVDTAQITLIPRGGTPLYDAIGRAVAHLRRTLTPQDNVVVVIITDGEENSSHEWTKPKVKALVDELEAASWKFLFLGANFDAFTEGESLGFARAAAASYQASGQSVNAMYGAVAANTLKARHSVASAGGQMTNSAKSAWNFTPDQIAAMQVVDDDVDPLQVTTSTTAADGTVFYSGSNQMPSLPVVPDDSEEKK
jgi:hypothetical protein